MDDHQRRLFRQMLDELDAFERTENDLGRLVTNLMGLVRAADLHNEQMRRDFYDRWVELDREHELRTEAWAPVGSASDHRLAAGLRGVRRWVEERLGEDDGELL